ncbi:MAG: hypothetical protein ACI8WB_006120, partial [Phenylobacterium sp.]
MTKLGNSLIRASFYVLAVIILTGILLWNSNLSNIDELIADYWYFFFIGIFAAT